MKNKLIFTVLILLSSVVFADTTVYERGVAKEKGRSLSMRTHSLEKQVQLLQKRLNMMQANRSTGGYRDESLLEMYAHGPAVVTSPALGVRRSAEDATDLMVKLSNINDDLLLLKTRQKMDNYAVEKGIAIPERPIIALSGGVEGQTDYISNSEYTKTDKSDINLSRAEIDVIGEVSPWATAAIVVAYEDSNSDKARRIDNSRFKLDRGFLTIGQLNKLPLYMTIGQLYAPFGTYSSHMITDPSTKLLGKTKERLALLGYSQNGFYAQIYGFAGDTKVISNKNIFGYSGANAGYDYTQDKFQIKIGGSIIGNLAESNGMQGNIFAKKDAETINSRVTGIDGRIKLGYAPFSISAEYVGATRRFNPNDLSFNKVGAKPQALNIEGAMEFEVKGKPSNFAVGYGQTWEALALNLPERNFFAEYDIAILKNTIFGIEYRHDINYGWTEVGIGNAASKVSVPVTGRHANTVTARLGVYF